MMQASDGIKEKRTGLKIDQIKDLHASLEHLITIGSKRKREDERMREFQTKHQKQLEELCTIRKESPPPSETPQSDKPQAELIFSEDIRVYGEIGSVPGFSKFPWPVPPNRKRRLTKTDNEWNIEHGDNIHPLSFPRARQSQIPINRKEDLALVDGTNLSVGTTDTSLAFEDVPRALLLRCWDRAVHAASTTIHTPVQGELATSSDMSGKDSTAKEKQNVQRDGLTPEESYFGGSILGLQTPAADMELPTVSRYYSEQENEKFDSKTTIAKCASLQLECSRGVRKVPCTVCTRTFPKLKDLREHFFGNEREKGCCWHKIPEKHRELIAKLLEAQVGNQANLLMGLIMERAKKNIPTKPITDEAVKRKRLLNWYDILRLLESSIEDSQPRDGESSNPISSHPVLETLQTKPDSNPVLINPTLLHSVRQRLVDRYAKVPP